MESLRDIKKAVQGRLNEIISLALPQRGSQVEKLAEESRAEQKALKNAGVSHVSAQAEKQRYLMVHEPVQEVMDELEAFSRGDEEPESHDGDVQAESEEERKLEAENAKLNALRDKVSRDGESALTTEELRTWLAYQKVEAATEKARQQLEDRIQGVVSEHAADDVSDDKKLGEVDGESFAAYLKRQLNAHEQEADVLVSGKLTKDIRELTKVLVKTLGEMRRPVSLGGGGEPTAPAAQRFASLLETEAYKELRYWYYRFELEKSIRLLELTSEKDAEDMKKKIRDESDLLRFCAKKEKEGDKEHISRCNGARMEQWKQENGMINYMMM